MIKCVRRRARRRQGTRATPDSTSSRLAKRSPAFGGAFFHDTGEEQLRCFSLLIDRCFCDLRQRVVCGLFLVKCLLQKRDRIIKTQFFGPRDKRAIAGKSRSVRPPAQPQAGGV